MLIAAFGLLGPAVLSGTDGVNAKAIGAGATTRSKPDIVFILTDDQRTDSLLSMPSVRRLLIDHGTRFTDAHVPNSLCCPSRSTILTGLYSGDTGVWTNAGEYGGWSVFAGHGNEKRTIAVTLQKAGYRTALIGKYLNHFGDFAPPDYDPPGWTDFEAFRIDHSGAYYDYRLGNSPRFHGADAANYSTDVMAHRAVNFIWSTPLDKSLFLYFAPYAPHKPWTPAPRYVGALKGKLATFTPASNTAPLDDKPEWQRRRSPIPQAAIDAARETQGESLMAVDDAVAAIVAALEHSDRLRDTLIVFMSDNGFMNGEHRMLGKSAPYQEATSIPLVIRWDGKVRAGAVDHRLAANVDIASTFADAAGAKMATKGLSLLGPKRRKGLLLEAAYSGIYKRPAYCGWRTHKWLYVHYSTGEEELYSVPDDPLELHNLAGDPELDGELSTLQSRAQKACRPMPPRFHW